MPVLAAIPARSRPERLRGALERLRSRTDIQARLLADPISIPRRFTDGGDIEVAGWLACALAYGRVSLFQRVLERILEIMENQPRRYALELEPGRHLADLGPVYYRMSRGADLACLVYLLQQVIRRHGSVGACFATLVGEEDADIGPALERFVRMLWKIHESGSRWFGRKGAEANSGLSQFLALPSKGSACKRLNLYLRWMVRPDDGVDFGLWKGVSPAKLIVPLDTHILRISRYLGLTKRRTPGWATAADITRALRRVSPQDPLKYDFYLCHHGISGNCPPARVPVKCSACALLGECAKGRMLVRPR